MNEMVLNIVEIYYFKKSVVMQLGLTFRTQKNIHHVHLCKASKTNSILTHM